jgi:hypothetical protein
MNKAKSLILGILVALGASIYCVKAHAATATFTIAATNATMSSTAASGFGTSTITLTSMNDYSGSVFLSCQPDNVPAGASVPNCLGSVLIGIPVNSGQTVSRTISLYNSPVPEPVTASNRAAYSLPVALAGGILLGLGLRRKGSRWLMLGLFAVASLIGISALSGCGGDKSVVTPGTYSYTIKGLDANGLTESATFQVTVP